MKKSVSLASLSLGIALIAAGVVALTSLDVPAAEAHGGRHYVRVHGDIDEAELERHIEHAMRSIEEIDLSHLEDLGEHISASVEAALEGLDFEFEGFDDDFDFEFDSARFEQKMERMAERLEQRLGRLDDHPRVRVHRRAEWDERALRREIRRLEAELEDLRDELEKVEDAGDI